jgi:ribonuclease P protein component
MSGFFQAGVTCAPADAAASAKPPAPGSPIRRLLKRADFLRAARGRKAVTPGLVAQAVANEAGVIRIGFTATRKIGSAVARNRAKRRLRAAAQALAPLYARAGADYVFIARDATVTRDWASLLDDMKSALITLSSPSKPSSPDGAPPSRPRPPVSDL